MTRTEAGLKPLELSDKTQSYMMQAVLSLSDVSIYPAPMAFMLQDFTQVQASVFQVARAPGKNVVYLGCLFLILGVFAMLYVRERRLWVWLSPKAEGSQATMAMSSNRNLPAVTVGGGPAIPNPALGLNRHSPVSLPLDGKIA